MSVVHANRGEWSELYALAYLLTKGGGFGADSNSQKNVDEYYEVMEVIDENAEMSQTVYRTIDSNIEIVRESDSIINIKKEELKSSMQDFLQDLLSAQSSAAFSSPSGTQIMDILKKQKPSASSASTTDTFLVLRDSASHKRLEPLAFSIKSEIGNPATIFNASRSTNVTYRIEGLKQPKRFTKIKGLKAKLQSLTDSGCTLEFDSYDSAIFEKNLESIDHNLPKYLAKLLLNYYISDKTKVAKIAEATFPKSNPDSDLKVKNLKKFLSAASMGLKANTSWSGYPKNFGGLLLVKRDGDVLFYFMQNLSNFEDYLFENLRLETPSTSRHGFGNIEKLDDSFCIKLNLQIRF